MNSFLNKYVPAILLHFIDFHDNPFIDRKRMLN